MINNAMGLRGNPLIRSAGWPDRINRHVKAFPLQFVNRTAVDGGGAESGPSEIVNAGL